MKLKRLIILCLLVLLCGALAGNVGLSLLARRLYGEKLLGQVWPAGSLPQATVGPEAPESKTILLMGDSRVADWGLPRIKNGRMINVGARGLTTGQLALWCGEPLEKNRPSVAVIQIGINDLKLLGVRPELRDTVVSTSVSNITQVVMECRRRGIRV